MTGGADRRASGDEGRRFPDRFAGVVATRVADPAWLARAAGVGLCVVSLGFVGLLVATVAAFGEVGLFADPLPKRVALALPPVVGVLAAATAVGAVLGWWKRYWSTWGRVHQTLLALLGVGFAWQLSTLGLLVP